MEKKTATVSTGKAAHLCGVKSDTVLKWIKAEKIAATKTAGGHYRIHTESLQPFLSECTDSKQVSLDSLAKCWEFCAKEGKVKPGCLQCIVFRSDAENCHILATLGKSGGYQGINCKVSCEFCEYFKYKQKAKSKVLVITENNEFIEKLNSASGEMIEFIFSCCGYTACNAIQDSHPDLILIDDTINSTVAEELCNHILEDKRVNNARVFLTSQETDTQAAFEQISSSRNFHTLQEYLDKRSNPKS